MSASEVELGREHVAEPTNRGLEPGPLPGDDAKAVLSLGDPCGAIAIDHMEQAKQGQQQEQPGRLWLRRLRDQEPDRRDRGVDNPHERDHTDLKPRRNPERRAIHAASRRARSKTNPAARAPM